MSSKIRCAAAALALLVLLSAGAAHARPPAIPSVSFESLWQWVASGWASLWAKEGGEMDPDGLVTPPPPTDAGSDMDPNGIRKEGGEMDPNGLVNSRPSTDEGSDMDPDG
jgi:hypothetical protein